MWHFSLEILEEYDDINIVRTFQQRKLVRGRKNEQGKQNRQVDERVGSQEVTCGTTLSRPTTDSRIRSRLLPTKTVFVSELI